MLKIRSSPSDGDQNAHEVQCTVENNNAEFQPTPTLDDNRNQLAMNSIQNYTQGDVQMPLSSPDLPNSLENREESRIVELWTLHWNKL